VTDEGEPKPRRPRTWGLMYEWHGKQYLGCGHGLAGIVLTLLQCEAELGQGLTLVHFSAQRKHILLGTLGA